jgi:hypothetical protein
MSVLVVFAWFAGARRRVPSTIIIGIVHPYERNSAPHLYRIARATVIGRSRPNNLRA